MRIYANQLAASLNKSLAPFYMVLGEEPFQVNDCVSQIRQAAKAQQFDEVIKLSAGPQFDWQELDSHYHSMSLFSSRTLIELDMNGHKPGKSGAEQLKRYSEDTNPDCIIVIHGLKAGQDIQRSAWFKALDKQGIFTPCYPLTGQHLRRWLDGHCQRLALNLDNQAKQLLLDSTQGNLLACHQELEKLALLFGQKPITAQVVLKATLNQNKFDIFDLADAVLQGNAERAVQVLSRLQNDNTEPTAIAWALAKEASQLQQLHTLQQQGENEAQAFKKLAIWQSQQGAYRQAMARLNLEKIHKINDLLAQFDRLFKQGELKSPYPMLTHISVSFCQSLPFEAPYFKVQ